LAGDLGRSMSTLRARAVIAGVTDAVSATGELELSGRALEAQMIKEALDDAGLSLSDVDGVCHSGGSLQLAEFLGIQARFTDSTMTGGSVFEVYLEHAASAVAAGVASCVLVVFAQTPRARRTAAPRHRDVPDGPSRGGPRMRACRTRRRSGSCLTVCRKRSEPTLSPPTGTWLSSAPPPSSSPRSR
jgi:hypothetical protein